MGDILDIKNKIITKYNIYCFLVNNENRCGFTDNNRHAQDFFVELGNLLWGYNLKNADYINKNQDTYDLIDKDLKLLVQVTSQNNSGKIKKTINGFIKNYKGEFNKIKIRIIGEKLKYKDDFSGYSEFFDKDQDIIDTTTISNNIREITDISKLGKIFTIINNYYQLSDETLNFETIEEVLRHIKSVLERKSLYQEKEKLGINRDRTLNPGGYMLKKNSINGVRDPFYNDKVIYGNSIEQFLKFSDENREIYNSISYSINLIVKRKGLIDTLKMFRNEIPFGDSKLTEALYIILSNMYFNCDIGENPNDING